VTTIALARPRWFSTSTAVLLLALGSCADQNEQGHLSARPLTTTVDVERGPFDEHLRSACGTHRMAAAGKAALTRWPYVQKVTDGSADVLWVSKDLAAGELTLTTPDGTVDQVVAGRVDLTAAPSAGGRQFAAELSGLEEDSIYCYTLRGADGTTWFSGAFATAPAVGEPISVEFSAFGDLGKQSPDQYALLEHLEDVHSDFVLLTGDIAYDDGTRAQLEYNVFAVYREMMSQIPFFPASGNHDYHTEEAEPFREAFALFENGGAEGHERWYSFDWGPVHVVVLDTERVGPTQEAWLVDDLAASDVPFTVAVLHRPPYSSGSHGSSEAVREAFAPLFADRVDLVLAGHDHDYERTKEMDGITYIVTGGGGRGTRSVGESDFTAVSSQVAHFVHVTVDENEMQIVAIDGMGDPFDALTIPARERPAGS